MASHGMALIYESFCWNSQNAWIQRNWLQNVSLKRVGIVRGLFSLAIIVCVLHLDFVRIIISFIMNAIKAFFTRLAFHLDSISWDHFCAKCFSSSGFVCTTYTRHECTRVIHTCMLPCLVSCGCEGWRSEPGRSFLKLSGRSLLLVLASRCENAIQNYSIVTDNDERPLDFQNNPPRSDATNASLYSVRWLATLKQWFCHLKSLIRHR